MPAVLRAFVQIGDHPHICDCRGFLIGNAGGAGEQMILRCTDIGDLNN